MPGGCKEQFIKWTLQYPKAKRPALLKYLLKNPGGYELVVLRSAKDVQHYIQDL